MRAGDFQALESRARSCSRMRGGEPTRAAHQAFPSRSQSSSRTRDRISDQESLSWSVHDVGAKSVRGMKGGGPYVFKTSSSLL